MSLLSQDVSAYRGAFELLERGRREPRWLTSAREAALLRFEKLGFPTTRDEAWRNTSVAEIARTPFRPADGARRGDVASATLHRLGLGGAFQGAELVFVNGRYAPDLSSFLDVHGVLVATLGEALASDAGPLDAELGALASDPQQAFLALNTALFEDGVVLRIAPGVHVEKPIHLLYLSTSDGAPTLSHPRTLVVAGRGSQATLLESYGGPNGESYLANAVSELRVEDGASVDHYTLERHGLLGFHTSTLAVRLGRDARYSHHAILIGGRLVRNDIDVVLDGPGADAQLLGLYVANFDQHIDSHTRVEHARPHGTSRELYKGILNGRARGVFHGRIVVRPDAQKTDAYQANKNLLLSREALVDSTPQLEIFADDVKCKHGSTTGQLDEGALFYLRSRGIDEQAARSLLTYAFASDLVSKIRPAPLRISLEAFLHDRLPAVPKEALA